MSLEEYHKKRDFDQTPEPAGGSTADPSAERARRGLLYVVQKHASRRLHYDLRLELDGVLLSWAVPKGPSLDPHDRHLATRVEDHPVEYGGFEGTIPEGEYGAGTVELWDRGTWEPEGDPHAGLEKGDLKFTLHGEKLKGSWVLVRMKPRPGEEDKQNWLLIKHRDEHAVDGDGQAILRDKDRSVASGRTLEEIAAQAQTAGVAVGRSAGKLDPGALRGARLVSKLPRFVNPELATLVEKAPEGDTWLHEVKYDGYRALSRVENGRVEIYSRNNKDWTMAFQPIVDDLARLPVENAMLDGEVVVQMPDGTTSFQALREFLGSDSGVAGVASDAGGSRGVADSAPTGRLLYYVFDLLHLNGYELLECPIEERKRLLKQLLAGLAGSGTAGRLVYSEHVTGDGTAFFRAACGFGLEGMVSKRAGSAYRPGVRGSEWQKTKCRQEQEFAIGGYTDPAGTRTGFGALLLGVPEGGALRYVGKVGTGFDGRMLQSLGERLRRLEADQSPFGTQADRAPRGAHWVKPELVAEVAFAEWTKQGGLRHASFKGLREDKPVVEVGEETPAGLPGANSETVADAEAGAVTAADAGADVATPRPRTRRKAALLMPGGGSGILTHPDKMLWPEDGVTKKGLADYYAKVAPFMLPYVLHRPLSMVRCPDGVAQLRTAPSRSGGRPATCFFYKHPSPEFQGPLQVISIVESKGPHAYLTITEPSSLAGLAQMGVLEIHVWGATWPDIEHPDMMVFDFDPDAAVDWTELAGAARLMRDVLGQLGLDTFVKTTGGKGLHVVAPIRPENDWQTVHGFCKAVAEAFVATAPERYTANMSKAKRTGKIFVDYVRNTRGSTSIAPYSTRAKEHATVAVPLRWDELAGSVRSDTYTVVNLEARLQGLDSDPWEGFREAARTQTITRAMKSAVGLGG
jgi:bifunctional non-homologous end joining protein LigD